MDYNSIILLNRCVLCDNERLSAAEMLDVYGVLQVGKQEQREEAEDVTPQG